MILGFISPPAPRRELGPVVSLEDECVICLKAFYEHCVDDVPSSTELRAMPCCHVFHKLCIFYWLRRSSSCPICRYELSSLKDENDVDEL